MDSRIGKNLISPCSTTFFQRRDDVRDCSLDSHSEPVLRCYVAACNLGFDSANLEEKTDSAIRRLFLLSFVEEFRTDRDRKRNFALLFGGFRYRTSMWYFLVLVISGTSLTVPRRGKSGVIRRLS